MRINAIIIIIISIVIFHAAGDAFAQSLQSVETTSTTTLDILTSREFSYHYQD